MRTLRVDLPRAGHNGRLNVTNTRVIIERGRGCREREGRQREGGEAERGRGGREREGRQREGGEAERGRGGRERERGEAERERGGESERG